MLDKLSELRGKYAPEKRVDKRKAKKTKKEKKS
jgi:hypothetical protein